MTRRLDQALGGNPFSIDESACSNAAQELKRYRPTISELDASTSIEATALFKLFFVSICHQINWDFLLGRMRESFFSNDPAQMVSRALTFSAKDIETLLKGYSRPERIKAPERSKIMRDVASTIVQKFNTDIAQMLFPPRLLGPDGLIERLGAFSAFSEDPLAKKSNVFVQELLREKVASFEDEAAVLPAVDYHLIRLYLRTGRVIAQETVVQDVLTSASPTRMRLITLLRSKVSDALSLTAFYARKTVFEVNYVEWQIARQRCEYDAPKCTGRWPDRKFDPDVIRISPSNCPNSAWCLAHNDPDWPLLREPEVKRAFY